jgi:hypothetical protein
MSKKRLSAKDRDFVAERACFLCEYCRISQDFSTVNFSVEHIVPAALGGTNALDNLAYSCQLCNNHKFTHTHAIDPETRESVPLFHPRQDQWDAHFRWSDDFQMIVGISPTGRATVDKLHLNRKGAVNLRRVLHADGSHPPK